LCGSLWPGPLARAAGPRRGARPSEAGGSVDAPRAPSHRIRHRRLSFQGAGSAGVEGRPPTRPAPIQGHPMWESRHPEEEVEAQARRAAFRRLRPCRPWFQGPRAPGTWDRTAAKREPAPARPVRSLQSSQAMSGNRSAPRTTAPRPIAAGPRRVARRRRNGRRNAWPTPSGRSPPGPGRVRAAAATAARAAGRRRVTAPPPADPRTASDR
jgi:hypothetical protein